MADTRALPVFGLTDDLLQLQDLRAYLNKHGAALDAHGPTELAANLLEVFLLEVVKAAHVVGKVESESESILASISSLFVAVSEPEAVTIVTAFCEVLTPAHFKGRGWKSTMCGEALLISEMDVSQDTINGYFKAWGTTPIGQRDILRLLHLALVADGKADQAAKVMITLLSTYSTADAATAVDDATECVRTAVVDPKSFSFDHILRLSAVQALEKSDPTMHKALQLFASGTLKDYKSFVTENPSFVADKLRVEADILERKMRLLTLMSLAEKNSSIPLPTLAKDLDIKDDEELEEFIIQAIQANAISGKVNEQARTLLVSSFQHRTFGREEWVDLKRRLSSLIAAVRQSHDNVKSVNQTTLVSA